MATDTDDLLCHCADLPTAIEAARKLYIQLVAADCPVYALGVASALKTIAIDNLVDVNGMTLPKLKTVTNHYTRRTRDIIDLSVVKEDIKIKRHVLYN